MAMDMDLGSSGSSEMHHDHSGSSEMHHDHSAAVEMHATITFMLCVHLALIAIAFGVILPYGFVNKQARTRFYLLIQVAGAAVGILGALCGHLTGISWYNPYFVDFAALYSLVGALGSMIVPESARKGWMLRVRDFIDRIHTGLLLMQPLVCWVFTGLGFISLLQFCKADHLGQCLAHGIMGTAFVAYGVILVAMMYVGEAFLRRQNRCQEFYDSFVIMLWGIINTFTEHRWGHAWNHGDIQHTSMGIVWWAAGLLGIYISHDRVNDRPRRNHIPAIVIAFTGYAMMSHTQNTVVSTTIHFMFGVFLILAALTRIIEISFVLKDGPHTGLNPSSWQFLTPFLLMLSGVQFMSATEEAMAFLHDKGIMAAPYVLVVASITSLIFLVTIFLFQSYHVLKEPESKEASSGIELRQFIHQPDEREFDISDEE